MALAINNVKFEAGKSVLLPTSLPVLDEIVYIMKNYPQYNLTIVGHTDNTGNTVSNQDLSERRALACFDYLVSKNVAADRMSHKGMGETQPIGDNNTPEGREINRRVVFDLILR